MHETLKVNPATMNRTHTIPDTINENGDFFLFSSRNVSFFRVLCVNNSCYSSSTSSHHHHHYIIIYRNDSKSTSCSAWLFPMRASIIIVRVCVSLFSISKTLLAAQMTIKWTREKIIKARDTTIELQYFPSLLLCFICQSISIKCKTQKKFLFQFSKEKKLTMANDPIIALFTGNYRTQICMFCRKHTIIIRENVETAIYNDDHGKNKWCYERQNNYRHTHYEWRNSSTRKYYFFSSIKKKHNEFMKL